MRPWLFWLWGTAPSVSYSTLHRASLARSTVPLCTALARYPFFFCCCDWGLFWSTLLAVSQLWLFDHPLPPESLSRWPLIMTAKFLSELQAFIIRAVTGEGRGRKRKEHNLKLDCFHSLQFGCTLHSKGGLKNHNKRRNTAATTMEEKQIRPSVVRLLCVCVRVCVRACVCVYVCESDHPMYPGRKRSQNASLFLYSKPLAIPYTVYTFNDRALTDEVSLPSSHWSRREAGWSPDRETWTYWGKLTSFEFACIQRKCNSLKWII